MTGAASRTADGRHSERMARAHISRIVEPGDRTLGRLVADHGYPGLVELLDHGDVPDRWLVRSRSLGPSTPDVVASARRRGIRVVVPGDPEWPVGVDALAHADSGDVACLWVRGRLPRGCGDAPAAAGERPVDGSVDGSVDGLLDGAGGRAVAIVGSRDASPYGESVAGALAADLVGAGWVVVSGAALGIDAAAHRGALGAATAGVGSTVAVLGCGVDRPYPAAHAGLLDRIAGSGAVVAELPPGSPPYPWRFPARNRVIAAMAAGVVVVEAGLRSGAMGTARAADALSRPVMAVPGPVHSRRSVGCHRLVRDGATLITGVRDVVEAVGPLDGGGDTSGDDGGGEGGAGHPVPAGGERAERVLRCLSRTRERTVDEVAAMAGMDPGQTRSVLLDLEITSITVRGVGGWRRAAATRGDSRGV